MLGPDQNIPHPHRGLEKESEGCGRGDGRGVVIQPPLPVFILLPSAHRGTYFTLRVRLVALLFHFNCSAANAGCVIFYISATIFQVRGIFRKFLMYNEHGFLTKSRESKYGDGKHRASESQESGMRPEMKKGLAVTG